MTKYKKDALVGTVIWLIIVGVPLAFVLGPIAFVVMTVVMFMALQKKKPVTPKSTTKRRQADELITVILPTIDNKN